MKKTLLTIAIFATLLAGMATADAQTTYRLTTDNRFYTIIADNNNVAHTSGPYNITGVATGQSIVTLTQRQQDNTLYAIGYDANGNSGQLYKIVNTDGDAYNAWPVGSNAVTMNLADGNANLDFINNNDADAQITSANGNVYVLDVDNGNMLKDPNSGIIYPNDDLQGNIATANARMATDVAATDNGQNNGLLLYPNPVIDGTARIVLPEAAESKVAVDLINMNGQVLRSFEFATGSYKLDMDLSRIPAGLYDLRVYEAGVMLQSIKMVKNRG